MTEPTDANAELMQAAVKRSHDQYKLNTSRAAFQAGAIFGSAFRTTPQPTQTQAGAVPLTREQVKAICVESGYEKATLQERADFINGIRHAERHHGIKGGQHG